MSEKDYLHRVLVPALPLQRDGGAMSEFGTFVCECCGRTLDKEWSDEDMTAEAKELFGVEPGGDVATVCDDCFRLCTGREPLLRRK